jgi:hypothetical protein
MTHLPFKTIAAAAALAAALATGARADVNKFSTGGLWADAGATSSEVLSVKGKFNTGSDVLKGRIKCGPDCPIRGRLKASCELGEGFYFVCTGSVRGKRCQVSGYLYQHGFEGTYACGERTGLWMFGNP